MHINRSLQYHRGLVLHGVLPSLVGEEWPPSAGNLEQSMWPGTEQGVVEPRHTATAIPFTYSFSGNSAASAPISIFMCLWAIYIFPASVYIYPPAEQADPSWEYIIRSQTHDSGNWDWGPDIPFSGNICFKFSAFCLCSAGNLGWRNRFLVNKIGEVPFQHMLLITSYNSAALYCLMWSMAAFNKRLWFEGTVV
jgi:hypothetical protein